MNHYEKGKQTKQKILTIGKNLFYEKGYSSVTMREIAADSNANLGLLNYYFNGKADLGMKVYIEIRSAMNQKIENCFPGREGRDYFLLSSAIELIMCLESREYGDFYLQISKEQSFKTEINETIISTMERYSKSDKTSDHAILSSLSIMAAKPALVEHCFQHPETLKKTAYLDYYLEMQAYHLGLENDKAQTLLSEIKKCYFTMAKNFTPIIEKIEE